MNCVYHLHQRLSVQLNLLHIKQVHQVLLRFASWLYTCSSSNVTASKQTVAYAVEYVQSEGTQTINRVEKGSLKIVPRPFDTGLDHNKLCSIFPHIADLAPRRANGFEEQISSSSTSLGTIKSLTYKASSSSADDICSSKPFASLGARSAI